MPGEPRRRKRLRLRDHDYSSYGAYFVTIVTHDRRHLFGDVVNGEMCLSVAGSLVLDTWNRLPQRFPRVELDAFVVMPKSRARDLVAARR
jgi:REP element-mobilizing transposase RayT